MEMITQLHLLESLKKNKLEIAIEEKDKKLSYAELLEKANQVSAFLLNQNLPARSVVAFNLDCISDIVSVMIGVMNVRMVFAPIDGSLPQKRLSDMIDDLNPSCFITTTEAKQVYKKSKNTFFLKKIYKTNKKSKISYPNFEENDDLYIYFTSGSTGSPKGIIGRNSSLIHFLKWEVNEFRIQKSARFSQFISPYFDAFLRDVFAPLLVGATICVPPKVEMFFTSEYIIPWIDANRISIIHCVPSIFKLFLDNNVNADHFGALEHILLSGEKISPTGLKNWYRIFGERIQLVNLYGTTETTMIRTIYKIQPADVDAPKISIGSPIADTRIIIADKAFKPCNTLIAGDLYIVSKYVSKGYLNSPELNQQKFKVLDPGTKQESIAFNTGDLGRKLADGRIELLGRADRQIKIRGVRVELDEIEITLAKSKYIADSVVMLDDDIDNALIAFVISEETIANEELKELIFEEISNYLPPVMIPAQLFVVEAFPLLRTGKVDKKALLKLRVERKHVLPTNDTEHRLLELWTNILNIDEISVEDGFLEVGGNSLSMMRLIARVFTEFKIRIALSELFSNLTIQKQAVLIKNKIEDLERSSHDDYLEHQEGINVIKPVKKQEHYLLSSAQKRLYFIHKLYQESLAYNLPQVVVLEGKFDKRNFVKAFEKLIKRHESLRTCFPIVEGNPVQKIVNDIPINVNFSKIKESQVESFLKESIKPFDLEKAPLIRIFVGQISPQKNILLVDVHHIISDGVTQEILIRDFVSLYAGEVLSPLKIQYKDFAEWQQAPQLRESLKKQRSFWLEQFSDEPVPNELPLDFRRPANTSFQGDAINMNFNEDITLRLNEFASEENVTMFVLFLAMFNVLLSKLTNCEDITMGTVLAGRPYSELENVAGTFVNTYALRNYPMGDLSFKDFLSRVKERTLNCFENELYQYEDLVYELNIERETNRNPLYDVMLSYQNFERSELKLPDISVKPYPFRPTISKLDLTFIVSEIDGKIYLSFQYATDLFSRETIEGFVRYFDRLVQGIVNDSEVFIKDLQLLNESDHKFLLENYTNSKLSYDLKDSIVDVFESFVKACPKGDAVVFGQSKINYRELNELSNQVARYLLDIGIKKGDIVGIMMQRSHEVIVVILGILKSGCAYLPIDTKLPSKRVRYILESCGAALLLGEPKLITTYTDIVKVQPYSKIPFDAYSRDNLSLGLVPSDLAYCIYTSGSTGEPKGVLVEHGSVVNLVAGLSQTVYEGLGEGLRVGLLASFSFDASGQQIFGALLQGNCLYICDEESRMFREGMYSFYKNYGIQISDGTPTHLRIFLSGVEDRLELPELKRWLIAGEVLTKDLIKKLYACEDTENLELYNLYGPTETCVDTTYFQIDPASLDDYFTLPIGRPLPNERVYVADDYGNIVPVGIEGELCIAGAGVARGYVAEIDGPHQGFVEGWVSGEERVYRTGDMVRWLPDGNLEYRGRKDSQLKLRGYRIEPKEIELALMAHDMVVEAAVLLVRMKEEDYLCAYYISKSDISSEILREYVLEILPDYMVPSFFKRLDVFPLTLSGKLDSSSLPIPDKSFNKVYVGPETPMEKDLVALWAELLKLDPDNIGVQTGFFELGGHSIIAIQMANRIQNLYGIKIKIVELFQKQTIRLLAGYIQANQWLHSDDESLAATATTEIEI